MEKEQRAEGGMTRILIFDGDTTFVDGLKKTIATAPDIEIVDIRGDIESAKEFILGVQERIDLILVNFDILKEVVASDMGTLLKLKANFPETRVVIMGERYAEEEVFRMVEEGIKGFFVKGDISSDFIIKCIRVVAGGQIWMDTNLVSRVFEEFSRYYSEAEGKLRSPSPEETDRLALLTKREIELLDLVSMSLKNDEIAERLFISTKTVKTHIRNIFEKLGSRNRVDATLLYIGASKRPGQIARVEH
ncbi:MAG: response regulator transcription factor [Deltaproteobacteria bacterium]|nr:response regulator transcription factor [Deltaproteobacteria bacterium]